MAVDTVFTNGIIAAREKYFLKDRLLRMCEVGADEAFRMLVESGFGEGESVSSVYEYEKLVLADSRAIDGFIREFSPSQAISQYLLAPRDFHNAKALVKAEFLGTDAGEMLAPDGMVSAESMQACFRSGDFTPLGGLGETILTAKQYIADGGASGAEIGAFFDKAMYGYLGKACSKKRMLKKFVADKADMTNILTAMRSPDAGFAEKFYVEGGNIPVSKLGEIFSGEEKALRAIEGSGKEQFLKLCFKAKDASLPMTEAERKLASYEADILSENKYDLKNSQPFLYYVFRRRAENENVRIIFACLLNGMSEKQIKGRLRGVQIKL
ncbi:MAG: V-type ATPase subunit [Clostridia bacterium]|nr:V-type ATPase subunit [Clostridia bacterium]